MSTTRGGRGAGAGDVGEPSGELRSSPAGVFAAGESTGEGAGLWDDERRQKDMARTANEEETRGTSYKALSPSRAPVGTTRSTAAAPMQTTTKGEKVTFARPEPSSLQLKNMS
jgi:hypothetical protein